MPLSMLLVLALVPLAQTQQGSIAGTVVDSSGSSVPTIQVKLSLEGRAPDRETQTTVNGEFSFADVPSGPFRLAFTAKGFASKTITGDLQPGDSLSLPPTALAVDTLNTEVNVSQTREEIAETQVKVEEQQRILGLVPNYLTVYDHDAEPLNTKQKFELTARTWLDPSAFVIEGIIAGVGQVQNSHKGFGQGAQGYGKRYGAGFADYGTSLMLANVGFTTLFRQDPRYFYKGTGTNRSRFYYAVSRTFICRGDNKKDQFCYSSLLNRLATGFVTNYYFPAADRDSSGTILRNGAIGFGADALGNIFQEFLSRKITRKRP